MNMISDISNIKTKIESLAIDEINLNKIDLGYPDDPSGYFSKISYKNINMSESINSDTNDILYNTSINRNNAWYISSIKKSVSNRSGVSSSINSGNLSSYIKDGRKTVSINTGKNVSIHDGISFSDVQADEITINNNGEMKASLVDTEKLRKENKISSKSTSNAILYENFKYHIKQDRNLSSSVSLDVSAGPLQGHFTTFAQITSALYGDLLYSENLYRILNNVHTIVEDEVGNLENIEAFNAKSLVVKAEQNTRINREENESLEESYQIRIEKIKAVKREEVGVLASFGYAVSYFG